MIALAEGPRSRRRRTNLMRRPPSTENDSTPRTPGGQGNRAPEGLPGRGHAARGCLSYSGSMRMPPEPTPSARQRKHEPTGRRATGGPSHAPLRDRVFMARVRSRCLSRPCREPVASSVASSVASLSQVRQALSLQRIPAVGPTRAASRPSRQAPAGRAGACVD